MFRKIKSDTDRQHLQDDLNKVTEWYEKWQMLFNFWKCKCLHARHGNEEARYRMGGTVLITTVKENNLLLIVSADLKVSEQYGIVAAKGNRCCKTDVDMLERVQTIANKNISKRRNIRYKMHLKEYSLTTLETRRLRGDQIEVFKILNVYENID